jgi:2-succinyl-5-enolpyruvyl-6-hydroxy-3-cyclohexene-1-carboxylate synthase
MFPSVALYLAEICAQQGVSHAILSPGSRVAPLAVALARHTHIQTYTFSDERTAGFVGLGIAQAHLHAYLRGERERLAPVLLACTSGTASYNYAPAVAEAFYQEIPLLILTADRPPEWIDQQDGQTLRQNNLFAPHVKASFTLPTDTANPDVLWHAQRIINEAINLAASPPFAPVHLNIPFREPFYPTENEVLKYPKPVKTITRLAYEPQLSKTVWNDLIEQWERAERKLIVCGQMPWQPKLTKMLGLVWQDYKVPIVADVIANLHGFEKRISQPDLLLLGAGEELKDDLQPDLLITFGQSVLSKHLKNFLRKYPARKHWHIQEAGLPADTFQSLTHHIPVSPIYFFGQLYSDLDFRNLLEIDDEGEENDYYALWQARQQKVVRYLHKTIPNASLKEREVSPEPAEYVYEMQAVQEIMSKIPPKTVLQLANSMPVRYANYALNVHSTVEIRANRGTSGIDGCNSTTIGNALAEMERLTVLLTGDVAFFYDRNALWHNYTLPNVRIILFNNGGGNIFRLIDGPSRLPELEEYFETHQKLTAQRTAEDAGFQYLQARNETALQVHLQTFFEASEAPKLLEVFTDKRLNAEVWKNFKEGLKE